MSEGKIVMADDKPLKFGSAVLPIADIVADATLLQLELHKGELNKHEVGMLIEFLKAKQQEMKPVQRVGE